MPLATKKKRPAPQAATINRITSGTPWSTLRAEAKRRFGISRFRPGQREVLEAVFARRDVVALMPTGAGKSVCYQLPALLLPGPVIVVSPLIALMRDQQQKAEAAHIPVEKLDSTLNTAERAEAQQSIEAGIPQLLYVTPERLAHPEFIETISGKQVSLLAIDEAHCISQWGHDFRPAYLALREARQKLGDPPVLALTATASDSVVQDIVTQLDARNPVIVDTGIERENLVYAVHPTVNSEAKQQRLLEMISQAKGTGIVYTASVRTADELYEWFIANNVAAGRYHGRLKAKEREAMQAGFMRSDYQVLVATKAFGMGIDKPDIRFVYHYEFPDSLESYYQEAGRAGRDGQPAHAVLLYRLEDKRIQKFFLAGRYPHLNEANRVYSALSRASSLSEVATQVSLSKRKVEVILRLLQKCGLVTRHSDGYAQASQTTEEPSREPATSIDSQIEKLLADYEERSRADSQRLSEMMHYAESPQCRTQLLRRYFGEDEGELCRLCDNCTSAIAPTYPATGAPLPVTRIDTMIGQIVTTAPETLPQPLTIPFKSGDPIRHRRFGEGKVLDLDGENLLARFNKAGVRKVRYTYVQKIA